MLLLEGFFSPGGNGYYLLVLVFMAALVGLYLWGSSRRDKSERADELQKTYLVMDAEKLASVPDGELVKAVAANLMGKLDKRKPDAYKTIPLLSHGRCVVYSVWLMCNELEAAGFEELFASPSAQFCELAADAFEELGAPACAVALRNAMEADAQALAELHADFLEAKENEQPLEKCVAYIRADPAAFLDASQEPNAEDEV